MCGIAGLLDQGHKGFPAAAERCLHHRNSNDRDRSSPPEFGQLNVVSA